MRRLSFVAATALGAFAPVAAAVPPRGPFALRFQGKPWRGGTFDPHINRHTGEPHRHAREIARRLWQEARQ